MYGWQYVRQVEYIHAHELNNPKIQTKIVSKYDPVAIIIHSLMFIIMCKAFTHANAQVHAKYQHVMHVLRHITQVPT